ncbi:MAG TPA: cation acetate symporter, partial [Marmoricola sp.]|nr:cation acetate symporter [Marmoricola sp.]
IHPIRAFRISAVVAVAVPLLVALGLRDVSVAKSVGLAFAVAASTFAPLLILGIWWRGLTDIGALAGLLVGGWTSLAGVVNGLVGWQQSGWAGDLLGQPALWTVPLAFLTMVVGSLLSRARVPIGVNRIMVRLHTPEQVKLDRGQMPRPID